MSRLRTKIYNHIITILRNSIIHVLILISISLAFSLIFICNGNDNCTYYYHSAPTSPESKKNIEPNEYYRDSRDIGKLLDITRSQIYNQLSKYNFSLSGASALEDLAMESGGRPLQSLIISTWRSGTSFLGELLNAIPGTYYHYEPLLYYGILQIRGSPDSDQALSTLKNMLKCNYDGLGDYFKYCHNSRLWGHCTFRRDLCYNAEFTSRLCKVFPFHTMKVVRIRLRLIQEILDDKMLNVRVILLIRDPRGVMQSRQHRDFCRRSPDCWDPSLLCTDMISDYVAADRILQEYPDRLMVVRYEELAMNPNSTAYKILKFLKLNPTYSLHAFLQSHTKVEVASVTSTFRVSRDVPFRWKYTLEFDYVEGIQMACKEAMLLWGYKMAHNKTHMTSKNFYPLKKYSI